MFKCNIYPQKDRKLPEGNLRRLKSLHWTRRVRKVAYTPCSPTHFICFASAFQLQSHKIWFFKLRIQFLPQLCLFTAHSHALSLQHFCHLPSARCNFNLTHHTRDTSRLESSQNCCKWMRVKKPAILNCRCRHWRPFLGYIAWPGKRGPEMGFRGVNSSALDVYVSSCCWLHCLTLFPLGVWRGYK